MNILIVEDEPLTAALLERLLGQYDPSINILAIIPSVKATVQWFQKNPSTPVDLIFMDIHLEDDLCFNIFEQVNIQTPVVFTTAYDDYMLKAFKVNSIDYLLKPLDFEDLSQALEKFKQLKQQFAKPQIDTLLDYLNLKALQPAQPVYKTRFFVSLGTKIYSIDTKEIAYFASEDKLTSLVTNAGARLPIDFSLEQLASGLLNPEHFFRVSRQHIITLGAIKSIQAYSKNALKLEVEPKEKQGVFVSRDRIADFKIWLGK